MTSPVNILLVDDEPRNLDVLESVLQTADYRLVRAISADEALKALISDDFAVIVLDIRMPGTSGLELAQMIKQRKKTQHIPIIFLTAYYQEDEHVMQGYSAGRRGLPEQALQPGHPAVQSRGFCRPVLQEPSPGGGDRRAPPGRAADPRAQRSARRRVNELAAANSELEAFSYSVSHDLRAPLRQVAGFVGRVQKLNREGFDPEAADQYLPLIQNSVTRMGRLIDDLLEFSRIGRTELHYQNVNLHSLLEQTLQAAQSEVAGREIQWKIESLPEVRGDAAMLRQVFANLIDNAVKFARPRDPAQIEIGSLPAEEEHVVFVRDNGVGFDSRYAHKLFGVFQRLHSTVEFDGTGIGLATVRRIIERHGGRTWAESVLDRGATFCFSLPR